MRRWQDMKIELGEEIRPSDFKQELVPLLMRLYTCEVK